MNNRECLLKFLEDYISKNYEKNILFNPWNSQRIPQSLFKQKSYQKWAAKEFLSYVKNSKDTVLNAGEEFMELMDKFSCDGNHENRWMFSVAYDVSVNLVELLFDWDDILE